MKSETRMKAIYPGTFDPVTNGHIDLMRRGAKTFSKLVVAVTSAVQKKPLFSLDERVEFVKDATSDIGNIEVKSFERLLVDFVRDEKATVILKGLRALSDFENELQMSLMNRRIANEIETVFMMPSEEFSFISSSILKEIVSLGGNIDTMAPPKVRRALAQKLL